MNNLPIIADFGIFAAGVALLIIGGESLVRGAVELAARLGFPPLIVGLTIVAFGTSAPELALNVIAAFNNHTELSFGNVVGSNIANIGLILGLASFLKPMHVQASLVTREIPLMLAATALLIGLCYAPPDVADAQRGLTRVDGGILLSGFGLVMWVMLRFARRGDSIEAIMPESEREALAAGRSAPALRSSMLMTFGFLLLISGGKLAETGAVGIATKLGMSNELIGLTVVALATSLPELATSLIAARRGQVDIAVGNVVGSNLFNILLVMGATAMVTPAPLPGLAFSSFLVMGVVSALIWPMSLTTKRRIGRLEGGLLLLIYFGYIGYEVIAAIAE